MILESPYRQLVEPLLDYLDEVAARRQPYELITVVMPQFVPAAGGTTLLHNQTAVWLRWRCCSSPASW